ncbi:hypothetical protein [Myxococcus sp. CA040A]|uniref:hypothetical protein n=1 Tax=Myxococcus sp. CA040A TaxID=2741738 RepID=UPI00157A2ABC|nr:hypothetical protein [Myxococcus sp. CA040A]NTX04236.1 hypothetical protein [Myxococcus sp. CA040A]
MDKKMRLGGGVVDSFRIPPIEFVRGECTRLAMPSYGPALRRLRDALDVMTGAGALRVTVANSFTDRGGGWWDRLRRLTAARAVAEELRQPMEVGRALCVQLGIDPDRFPTALNWLERKLLDFEVATASTDIVIVADSGLGVVKRERFLAHVDAALRSERFAVLMLDGPRDAVRPPMIAWKDVPKPWGL